MLAVTLITSALTSSAAPLRVFDTAWGHDQRTSSNLQFVALIENGIGWAAQREKDSKKP